MIKINNNLPSFNHYAIFETGGKQYQALEGKTIAIEKLDVKEGDNVTFDKVLLKKNGDKIEIGHPYVNSAVKAIVLKHLKGPKVITFKFKRRKKHRKKMGHRQPITVVRVESI